MLFVCHPDTDNYRYFQGLYEMLKQVQHDSGTYRSSTPPIYSASTAFPKMTRVQPFS
jgi:hypothetical protein